MMAPLYCVVFFTFITSCLCGDMTILESPSSLRFGKGGALRVSSVNNMMAVGMGYTPHETTAWTGMTVISPFKSPSAAVVVAIDGSGSELQLEGKRYTLQEDQSFLKVYGSLHSLVMQRAQRPTHFVHMEVADGAGPEDATVSLPKDSSLDRSMEPDAAFLLEVSTLPTLHRKLQEDSSVPHGGQDFIFYQLESFSLLVKTYGDDSPQVHEGKQLLRAAIDHLVAGLRTVYADDVLVLAVVLDKSSATLARNTRDVLQTAWRASEALDLNLAAEYSEDYPAIFNIILFMSILLAVSILAVSVATANMDPGRDSIIYRMTNPRMKKDQ